MSDDARGELDRFCILAHLLEDAQGLIEIILAVGSGEHDPDASLPSRDSGEAQGHGEEPFIEEPLGELEG